MSATHPDADNRYAALGDIGQQQAINRAMLCTLGSASCPPRPLIVTDWEFLYNTEHKSGIAHGEEVWIAPIVSTLAFSLTPGRGHPPARL